MKQFLKGVWCYWRCAYSYMMLRFQYGNKSEGRFKRLLGDFRVLFKRFWNEDDFGKYCFAVKASYDPSLLDINTDFSNVFYFEFYKNEKMNYSQKDGR